MEFHKLTSTDAFIVFDLDDVPAVGIVRQAKKVLKDGAELLARSTTYAAASFGLRVSGGSAGINALPDDRDAALASFLEEVAPLVQSGRWLPGPGVGVSAGDLAALPRTDDRVIAFDPTNAGESAVAAALGARGTLEGATIAVVGGGPVADAAVASAATNGAQVEADASFAAPCDVLLVGGKAGVLEHDLAATVQAKVVVPMTPVPITARALAILGRAGVIVVPDFLATAAGLLAAVDPDAGDPMLRVHDTVASHVSEGTGMWMAAVAAAEQHLSTWQEALPFGRPLA